VGVGLQHMPEGADSVEDQRPLEMGPAALLYPTPDSWTDISSFVGLSFLTREIELTTPSLVSRIEWNITNTLAWTHDLSLSAWTLHAILKGGFSTDRSYEAGSPGGDHLVPQMDELWTRKQEACSKSVNQGQTHISKPRRFDFSTSIEPHALEENALLQSYTSPSDNFTNTALAFPRTKKVSDRILWSLGAHNAPEAPSKTVVVQCTRGQVTATSTLTLKIGPLDLPLKKVGDDIPKAALLGRTGFPVKLTNHSRQDQMRCRQAFSRELSGTTKETLGSVATLRTSLETSPVLRWLQLQPCPWVSLEYHLVVSSSILLPSAAAEGPVLASLDLANSSNGRQAPSRPFCGCKHILICSDHSSRLLKAEEYSRVVFTSAANDNALLRKLKGFSKDLHQVYRASHLFKCTSSSLKMHPKYLKVKNPKRSDRIPNIIHGGKSSWEGEPANESASSFYISAVCGSEGGIDPKQKLTSLRQLWSTSGDPCTLPVKNDKEFVGSERGHSRTEEKGKNCKGCHESFDRKSTLPMALNSAKLEHEDDKVYDRFTSLLYAIPKISQGHSRLMTIPSEEDFPSRLTVLPPSAPSGLFLSVAFLSGKGIRYFV
ncbi:hypothetical protein U0070_009466, partial [Myodes glareolus]